MSIYRELDPIPEHRTQFAFKGNTENIAKENIPNTHAQTNILISKYNMFQDMSLSQIP